jgi:hypothetical protein
MAIASGSRSGQLVRAWPGRGMPAAARLRASIGPSTIATHSTSSSGHAVPATKIPPWPLVSLFFAVLAVGELAALNANQLADLVDDWEDHSIGEDHSPAGSFELPLAVVLVPGPVAPAVKVPYAGCRGVDRDTAAGQVRLAWRAATGTAWPQRQRQVGTPFVRGRRTLIVLVGPGVRRVRAAALRSRTAPARP